MGKRRAQEALDDPEPPSKTKVPFGGASGGLSTNDERNAKFKLHLTALNNQFAKWVKDQQTLNLHQFWTTGLNDYINHANKIQQEFKDVLGSSTQAVQSTPLTFTGSKSGKDKEAAKSPASAFPILSPPTAFTNNHTNKDSTTSAAGAFSFGSANNADKQGGQDATTGPGVFAFGKATTTNKEKVSSAAATSNGSDDVGGNKTAGLTFGMPPPSPQGTSSFFGFPSGNATGSGASADARTNADTKSAAEVGGAFKFGTSSSAAVATDSSKKEDAAASAGKDGDAAAAKPNLFSFGGGLPAPTFGTSSTGFFGFGGSSSAAAPAGGDAGTAGGDDDGEDEGPKRYESEVKTSEEGGDIQYKAKAKLHHLKDGEWTTKGVGLLMLRTPKDAPNKPFITFTTESGRVLYTAAFSKTMALICNAASKSVSWNAPWSVDGKEAPTPQSVMAKFAKGKDTEFQEALKKLQAAM